ncbi:MAG: hypothetical protein ACRDNT_02715, partial [Streptosporangiaceae bacterium]
HGRPARPHARQALAAARAGIPPVTGNRSPRYPSLRVHGLIVYILQRQNIQWNTFALQLTAAGVVFSFALSNPSHTGFLLILPVVTYALTGRYVSQSIGTEKVGIYIREVLDVKLKGQLHWEEWNKTQEWNKTRPTIVRTLT